MAFHGDCSSYPVPELLQWLDSSRKTGALTLSWEGGQRRLFLLTGQIVATASQGLWERVSRLMERGGEGHGDVILRQLRASGEAGPTARQLAEEDQMSGLVDLIASQRGQFSWTEDADRSGDEWVSMELSVRQVLFEALRRVDEQPDVERVLTGEHVVLRALGANPASDPLQRIMTSLIQATPGITVGQLWLSVGLPRGAVARAVYDLLRSNRVALDGTTPAPRKDAVTEMLEKGITLLRERQFDAAALVFATLLERDPTDRRVRECAIMAQRESVAALYRQLPPVLSFDTVDDPHTLLQLRPEERTLLAHAQAGWDVSTLVLSSPLKELDTLRALQRMERLGLLHPRRSVQS